MSSRASRIDNVVKIRVKYCSWTEEIGLYFKRFLSCRKLHASWKLLRSRNALFVQKLTFSWRIARVDALLRFRALQILNSASCKFTNGSLTSRVSFVTGNEVMDELCKALITFKVARIFQWELAVNTFCFFHLSLLEIESAYVLRWFQSKL